MVRPVDSDKAYTEEMFVFDEFNAAWFKDSLFDWLKSVIQHKSDPYLEGCAKFAVHNTVAYLIQNQSK